VEAMSIGIRFALLAFYMLYMYTLGSLARADEVASSRRVGVLVTPGQEQDAISYYKRISSKLGVSDTESNLSNLSVLLTHFGLKANAETLESSTPGELAAAFPNGQVLAARFFAPKIVDFNFPNANAAYPFNAGWRKLVRVSAQTGSNADGAGLAAAYVLFNYVQKDPSANPFPDKSFKFESFNTQVIIVPKKFTKDADDSIFFLDYDTRTGGYKIHRFLAAAFDTAPDPKNTKQNYYVPIACAQCHGHDQEAGAPVSGKATYPYAKVNYLDTDQWYDMASFGDFPSTISGPFDVLFDGGKDHASTQYKQAVGVMRTLNGFIHQQNLDSARSDGSDLFKIKAVDKWLSVHQGNDAPVAPIGRALDLENGAAVWKDADNDKHLLGLLDRYCFRCHSSVLYDVFDKQGVLDERGTIIRRVQLPSTNVLHMPQGRVLDSGTVADFLSYLKNQNK
jgi:hypothetical protein